MTGCYIEEPIQRTEQTYIFRIIPSGMSSNPNLRQRALEVAAEGLEVGRGVVRDVDGGYLNAVYKGHERLDALDSRRGAKCRGEGETAVVDLSKENVELESFL